MWFYIPSPHTTTFKLASVCLFSFCYVCLLDCLLHLRHNVVLHSVSSYHNISIGLCLFVFVCCIWGTVWFYISLSLYPIFCSFMAWVTQIHNLKQSVQTQSSKAMDGWLRVLVLIKSKLNPVQEGVVSKRPRKDLVWRFDTRGELYKPLRQRPLSVAEMNWYNFASG